MAPPPQDFEQFYLRARHSCLRALLATVPDVATGEDLVAEAFARAWERWPKVRRHPAPEAWVVRTAINLHHDQWRRERRPRRPLRVVTDADQASPLEASPLDPVLVEALLGLSERQREVLALRVLLGLSNEQTAVELGISPGTVPVHLRRALDALRRTYPTREAFHERSGSD